VIRIALMLAALAMDAAHGADLNHARGLVDSGRYAEAIAVYDSLLSDRPGDADLLIEAARVNAWADRHGESARLYRSAIDVAPARRPDIVLSLAWQLAWGGRSDEAISLFREAAAVRPAQRAEALHGLAEAQAANAQLVDALATYDLLAADPNDLKAQLGAARMLRWLDRHDAAAARYRSILAAHPDASEARLGLARSLNYSGRHLDAVTAYAVATADDAALARQTRLERATALRWAGLEDLASHTLGDAADTDAAPLRARLAQETAHPLRVEYDAARDSDNLKVQALRLGWTRRLDAGRSVDVSARVAQVEQYSDRVSGRELLIRAGSRLGGPTRGLLWPSLTVGVRDYDGWQTGVWKLQAKWLPADRWRVDFEAGNEVIENVDALGEHVTLDAASASADWQFAPRWRATAGLAVLRFDDDNRRIRAVGRIEHVVRPAQPRLVLGAEAMGFNDAEPEIDRGYYNPARYREWKGLARAEYEMAGWLLEARLALGKLRETPGNDSGLYAWEVAATHDLTPMLRLRLNAGGSDSGAFLATGSGYNRNTFGASLIAFH
jgi:tetratricopeptide (TPR) repeat protein